MLEKKWKNQVFQEYNMNNWFTSKLITYNDIDQILWGEIRVFKYYQCPSWMKKAFGSVTFALHCKGWKQKLCKSTEKKSSLHLNQQTFEETHRTSNVNPCSTVCMTKTKVVQIKSVLVGDSHEYQPWAVPPFWQSVVRVKKNKWKKKIDVSVPQRINVTPTAPCGAITIFSLIFFTCATDYTKKEGLRVVYDGYKCRDHHFSSVKKAVL